MCTGESVAISKIVSVIFTILFFDLIPLLPWAVVLENLLNQSNSFEDVALNMDTNKIRI